MGDSLDWRALLLAVYVAGIALQLALLGRNALRVRATLRASGPLDLALLRPITARLQIRKLPQLRQIASGSPFLCGILRPTIVLPQTLGEAHIEAVLAHELAHLRRRDLAWNMLLWVLQTLLWFHPLAWVSRRFHALEIESACDELTLKHAAIAPKHYGALLLNTANIANSPLAAGVNDSFFALQTRIERLGHAPKAPRKRVKFALSVALLVSFAAVVPLRLTARAQSEAKIAQSTGLIRGVVTYKASVVPLAGQVIQLRDDTGKLQNIKTDAQGKFSLRARAGTAVVWLPRDNKPISSGAFKGKFSFVNTEILNYAETAESGFHLALTVTSAKFTVMPPNKRASDDGMEISASELVFLPVKADATRQIEIHTSVKPASIGKTGTLSGTISLANGQKVGALVAVRPASAANFSNSVSSWADEKGRYSIEGLQPGDYKIAFGLKDKLVGEWAVPLATKKTIRAGANRADFELTRGAKVTGVVWAKSDHHVIPNVEIEIVDADGNKAADKTRANGVFRFRVMPGRYTLRLRQQGTPPPGFALTKQALYFNAKDGGGLHTTFELPKASAKPAAQPVTGTVVGPDGKARANAVITVEGVSPASPNIWRGGARTDKNGRFEVPAKLVKTVARLTARDGANANLITPRGTVVREGDDVTLQLEADVYAAFDGQIVDKKTGRPMEGVKVICHAPVERSINGTQTVTTGADGRFRFDKLRPFESSFLQVSKGGYEEDGAGTFVLQKNETKRLTISMRPLDETLSGRVLLANGQAAGAGYKVVTYLGSGRTATKADGSFSLPQVLDEKFTVLIFAPAEKKSWGPFWTRGGRSDVSLQLTDARLNVYSSDSKARAQEAALLKSRTGLIGQGAPPLRAQSWIGAPPSFAGKITLIHFISMRGPSSVFNDFARAFGGRGVQVVGVEQSRVFGEPLAQVSPARTRYLRDQARQLGVVYPIAIDKPLPDDAALMTITGQSQRLYRGTSLAIVGRDGVVKWVGNDPGQAIAKTAELASK